MANNLGDILNDETREALQTIADAQHKAVDEQKAKRDRTKQMADVIKQQRKGGGFKGDTKVRWTLRDADMLLICSTNLTQEQLFGGTVDEPDDPNDPNSPTHKVTYPARCDHS